ncbi:MAG: WecB/TagA/CpsF family glycosyltransferase [Dehalococcoidia bacterium]|nr:WecB/TagA/CpsF family glycosyltransferase [Dehalococcoidia bacterium]
MRRYVLHPAPRTAHVPVGPLAVLNGDLADAAYLCMDAIEAGAGLRVATANLDFVARARRDPVLRADLATSSLVVADGAPVAWLARLAGATHARRVTGVDLVAEICERGAARGGLRVASYGSTADVAAAGARALEAAYPGVRFVLQICPPFRALSDDEVAAYHARIAAARPDVVLVALGCPRQERFSAEHFEAAPGAVWIGIGGTFDFYAGIKRRAPAFLQAVGAEWVARLAQDPRRLWRRYLLDDIPAFAAVSFRVLSGRLRHGPVEVSEAAALASRTPTGGTRASATGQ